MENKNEIMSFDDFNKEEDKHKIVKRNVKKIDLDNPQTIMYYGSDILARVEELRDEIPKVFSEGRYLDYQFREPMNSLKEFNDALISDTKPEKDGMVYRWASGICNALNKITRGRLDLLNVNENDAKTYDDYLKNLRKVCEQIQRDKNSLESDTVFFSRFKTYIQMIAEKLGEAIEKGDADVERYYEELKELEVTSPEEAEVKKMYLEVAKERILSLRSSQTVLKGLCSQIDLKNAGAISLKTKYDEYLGVTASTLAAYGTVAIGIKRDSQKISRLQEVRDEGNQMIINSSEKLTDNIGNILEFSEDSLIRKETLQEVASQFYEGVQILSDMQAQKEANRDSVIASLDEINKIFDDYKLSLSQGTLGIESISGDSHGSLVKRGFRRGNSRGRR